MRERREGQDFFCPECGITPAYAGKTTYVIVTRWNLEDHPRVCGKDAEETPSTAKGVGSPPRMRERRQVQPSAFGGSRITPAYAGKTQRGFGEKSQV